MMGILPVLPGPCQLLRVDLVLDEPVPSRDPYSAWQAELRMEKQLEATRQLRMYQVQQANTMHTINTNVWQTMTSRARQDRVEWKQTLTRLKLEGSVRGLDFEGLSTPSGRDKM